MSFVIHEKCRDLNGVFVIRISLLDISRVDFCSCGRKSLSRRTNCNVKRECLGKVLRHVAGSFRSPDTERSIAPQEPPRKPQIRNSNNMVRMKMSEKEAVDFARTHSGLRQANHGTAATIKQQPLAGDFDENGRSKSLSIREGSSRTEHRDAH